MRIEVKDSPIYQANCDQLVAWIETGCRTSLQLPAAEERKQIHGIN